MLEPIEENRKDEKPKSEVVAMLLNNNVYYLFILYGGCY
jgi:hypothetical protein